MKKQALVFVAAGLAAFLFSTSPARADLVSDCRQALDQGTGCNANPGLNAVKTYLCDAVAGKAPDRVDNNTVMLANFQRLPDRTSRGGFKAGRVSADTRHSASSKGRDDNREDLEQLLNKILVEVDPSDTQGPLYSLVDFVLDPVSCRNEGSGTWATSATYRWEADFNDYTKITYPCVYSDVRCNERYGTSGWYRCEGAGGLQDCKPRSSDPVGNRIRFSGNIKVRTNASNAISMETVESGF